MLLAGIHNRTAMECRPPNSWRVGLYFGNSGFPYLSGDLVSRFRGNDKRRGVIPGMVLAGIHLGWFADPYARRKCIKCGFPACSSIEITHPQHWISAVIYLRIHRGMKAAPIGTSPWWFDFNCALLADPGSPEGFRMRSQGYPMGLLLSLCAWPG